MPAEEINWTVFDGDKEDIDCEECLIQLEMNERN
jgi:hypothetical protein